MATGMPLRAANGAERQMETASYRVVEDDVTVRPDLTRHPRPVRRDPEDQVDEARVRLHEKLVQGCPTGEVTAGQADHMLQVAVELDDVTSAGCLMQSVDVLGDDSVEETRLLKPRHGAVTPVRSGP